MVTPLINWFDTFGISQSSKEIDFDNPNTEIVEELTDAKIQSEEELGDVLANGYYLISGGTSRRRSRRTRP